MELQRAQPCWGFEFDWLGTDRNGHVALFTTVGYGAVPVNVNLHADDADHAIEHLARLPLTGQADQIVTPKPGRDSADWHAFSPLFYAYDWNLWPGPYIRLSAPSAPITDQALRPCMKAAANCATFELEFTDTSSSEINYSEPPIG